MFTGVFAEQEEQYKYYTSKLTKNNKGKFSCNYLFQSWGTLVARIFYRPRRVAPPLEHLNKFMNINSRPTMTWDFAPFSLRGVVWKDTFFQARIQIQIVIFLKNFVTGWNSCPDSSSCFLNFFWSSFRIKKNTN